MKVILYSDGSSRGNPGPGGFGTVLHFTDSNGKLHTRELSQGYTCTKPPFSDNNYNTLYL